MELIMRKLCCHKRALWFSGARGSMSADGARTLSCSRTTPIAGTLSAASSAKFNSLCSAAIVRKLENEQLEPDTERVKSAECEGERILRGAQSSRRFCAHFPPILTFPDPTLPRAPSYTHNPVPAINTFWAKHQRHHCVCKTRLISQLPNQKVHGWNG